MNVDREWRLRLRIDDLLDDRDQARAQLEECRQARRRLSQRVQTLDRSLALWKSRARAWARR